VILIELGSGMSVYGATEDLPPFGWHVKWPPLKNSRSLCIDVVAIISSDYDQNPRSSSYITPRSVLSAASEFAQLKPQNGCVRITITDPLRMKTLFHHEDAKDFDWQYARQMMPKQKLGTISADVLRSQTEASAFLRDQLQKVLQDNACASGEEPPLKIVIVISHGILFAKHTKIQQVTPQRPASARFFYYAASEYAEDDVFRMLKRTRPQKLIYPKFQALISEIEKLSLNSE
jgi:hypothetical protein